MKWGKRQPVSRVRVSRWSDIRLWLGVSVIIGSMFIGARVIASGESTVTLWTSSSDLSVGSEPRSLVPVVVSRTGVEAAYFQGPLPPEGVVVRPIAAGEFVPLSAVAIESEVSTLSIPELLESRNSRVVTVPVDPLHVTAGLAAGDHVDVWASPDETNANSLSDSAPGVGATPVLTDIKVVEVAGDTVGARGEIGVVLSVSNQDVATLISAIRTSVIDLVQVPISSQTPVS